MKSALKPGDIVYTTDPFRKDGRVIELTIAKVGRKYAATTTKRHARIRLSTMRTVLPNYPQHECSVYRSREELEARNREVEWLREWSWKIVRAVDHVDYETLRKVAAIVLPEALKPSNEDK